MSGHSTRRNFLLLMMGIFHIGIVFFNPQVTTAQTSSNPHPLPLFQPPAAKLETLAKPLSIRFVTTDDFPPFNFLAGDEQLTGYNVELARAICQRLSIPCTIQVRPFGNLVQALLKNEADAVIAGIANTPALSRLVDYSNPYLRLPARFVRQKKSMLTPTPETMKGRKVAVVKVTRYADFLRDFFPETQLRETESLAEALNLLAGEQVDAVFGSAVSSAFWLAGPQGSRCCAFAGGAYSEPAYFGPGLSIALPKGNAALRQVMDETLASLESEGVMAELYLRFFPVGLY